MSHDEIYYLRGVSALLKIYNQKLTKEKGFRLEISKKLFVDLINMIDSEIDKQQKKQKQQKTN